MILTLLSKIYGKIIHARNRRYDEGKKEIVRCSVPVLSVGNISAGGTGKTPFVIYLANLLVEMGHKPAVIGKGYKRKSKSYTVVSDGKVILADVESAGDEMIMLSEKLNVPIIAHESKSDAALKAEKNFDIDSIIIDDGFQHRKLHRDLDIVLIDHETLQKSEIIPKGRLREPLESIRRANVIVRSGDVPDFAKIEDILSIEQIVCKSELIPGQTFALSTGAVPIDEEIIELKKGCITVSGIAKPERFWAALAEKQYTVLTHLSFSDHHNYSMNDVSRIVNECERKIVNFVITTDKDAVKLRKFITVFENKNIIVCVLPVEVRVSEGKEELIKIIGALFVDE